ncbi:MAG: MarR family transcriptional regulator [Deltaproteobacteria bacterium]|nr:MarR family transcriptional regulator [Deltaproteobacteria bacterium]
MELMDCCDDRKLHEIGRFSLPYAELKCLMLFRGERYLTVKGIARKLEVAKSRVTKLINSLFEKRLVNRIDDPQDARIRLISLSGKGKAMSKEIEDFEQDIFRQMLLQMDAEERKSVLSNLDILRSAMEAVKKSYFK